MSLSKENVKYTCVAVSAVAASYLAYKYFTSESKPQFTQEEEAKQNAQKQILNKLKQKVVSDYKIFERKATFLSSKKQVKFKKCEGNHNYENPVVAKKLKELGDYKYGPIWETNMKVEVRDAVERPDHSKYEGEWIVESNEKHGKGKITWVDGSVFEGTFKQGKICDKGRIISATGDYYIGEFLADKAHGVGKMTKVDGSTYEGEFKMNMHHGEGTENIANDHKYIGQFKNDHRHGKGELYHSEYTYKGQFVCDKMQGCGTKTMSDGTVFQGYFFNNQLCLADEAKSEKKPLYKNEAFQRSKDVQNVSYKLAYALIRGGETFHGQVQIKFTLSKECSNSDNIFVDYRGELVVKLVVNESSIPNKNSKAFRNHRVYFPKENLKEGENTVVIRFVSNYVRDCQGIHYFKDKEDNEEYLYSQHEAADAHKAFPCFDQPDMKAPYKLTALVPHGWVALSTMYCEKGVSSNGSKEYSESLKDLDLDEKEFTELFNGEKVSCYDFGVSPKISVYLYSIVAGPYDLHESSNQQVKDYKVPMRFYCRKSLSKFLEPIKEDYFWVSKCGIDFYEELFSTEYPWGKLDQVWVPDYNMGAMENVGCVIYRDDYIQREEKQSEYTRQCIYNTFLHEISHMWFGNLVTMKWWDDLWLNESFANYVSFICLDEAKGLEKYKDAWSIFINQNFSGLTLDQKPTTHPIQVDVINTDAAQDIFDGISYGKGASWLKQTFHRFGREVFKTGIASYFKEFRYQNTELQDFIRHISDAAKKHGFKEDLTSWADTWVKCAGCNIISHDIVEEKGKIKKFTVNQKVNQHGEGNRLRVQKYSVAFYDEKMKITKKFDILTKDDKESFDLTEVVGEQAPFAYHINHGGYGYAKFVVDPKSLSAFEGSLNKIESSISRKQLYYILFDMIKNNEISGAQWLNIVKKQMASEVSTDVISIVFKLMIPTVIGSYIPLEQFEQAHADIFEMVLDGILSSGNIEDEATIQMVLGVLLESAKKELDIRMLLKWFNDGHVFNSLGERLDDIQITIAHRHTMVKRIWSSLSITLFTKECVLKLLKELDKTDRYDNTEYFCKAAHFGNKDQLWNKFFSSDVDKWGLHAFQNSFSGFNQKLHSKHTAKYEDQFFEKITGVIKSKGRFVALAFFQGLKPVHKADEATISKFEKLLATVVKEDKDNVFYINMLKSTISDLQVKKSAQQASLKYLNEAKK